MNHKNCQVSKTQRKYCLDQEKVDELCRNETKLLVDVDENKNLEVQKYFNKRIIESH